jgi:hypothetical protein
VEDPSSGYLKQRGYTLEFQLLGDADEGAEVDARLDTFTIAVRGRGKPLPTIVKLCKTYGWSCATPIAGRISISRTRRMQVGESFRSFVTMSPKAPNSRQKGFGVGCSGRKAEVAFAQPSRGGMKAAGEVPLS